MEISAKKRFGFRILFVIGLIVGFITLICGLGFILTLAVLPITLEDLIEINPIGFLFLILIFVICPILLIWISIVGLLFTK